MDPSKPSEATDLSKGADQRCPFSRLPAAECMHGRSEGDDSFYQVVEV